MARLSLLFLGPPSVTLDGELVRFAYDKVRALLAYLVVESHREQSREMLAGLLWPESPEPVAHKDLSQALFRLRRAIGDPEAQPPFLLITRDDIGFNPAGDFWLDVAAFDELARTYLLPSTVITPLGPTDIERIEDGLALYRGSFLQDFSLPDSAEFEEWALLQREQLHRQAMDLLDCVTAACEAAGQIERALGHARRQLELDAWREESHQQVMRLLARLGRRSEALAQYQACRRVLAQELGVEPGAETLRLYEQIRDGVLDRRPLSAAPPRLAPSSPPHNLPPDPTPLVGRERELARLAGRCADPACRLVTIVGPGGVGKTRLAIQAARSHLERFRDGVFFVDLAPVPSADLLPEAILTALGVSSGGAVEPDRRLLDHLADRQMLLVLDNFEHLLAKPGDGGSPVDGTRLLVEILRAAPGVKLLVTSRERLDLQAEWLEPLGGLETPGEDLTPLPPSPPCGYFAARRGGSVVPSPSEGGDLGTGGTPPPSQGGGRGVGDTRQLEDYAATALFLGCVRRLQPDYLPEPADIPHIAHICRLLEGMPLGIELAAPWVQRMPVAEVADELAKGLDLLTTTYRDVPQRHRSMRAAFDRSWRLLTSRQQGIMRQLSVFRGGFTREAAGAFSAASAADLSGLVSSSWLRVEPSSRYAIHELIRQYCEERLEAEHEAQTGERADQVRERHAAYYTHYLKVQEPDINWRADVMARFSPEIGNLDAAWRWVIEHGRYELANDMVMGLYHIALMEGRYRETGQRFEWAILCLQKADAKGVSETDHELAGLLLALLLFVQGDMCLELGLLSQAQAHIARSYELLDAITPGWRRDEYAFFTSTLEARLRAEQGDFAQALRLGREELTCLRETDVRVWPHVPEVGTLFMEANTCQRLAYVSWYAGQYDVARDWLGESLAIRERLGEERYRAHGLRLLADQLRMMGETEEAERLATQGQALSEAHRDWIGTGSGHLILGAILLAKGRSDEARARFCEGLAMARESGNHGSIVTALNGLGAVALACGDFDEAGRWYEESRASFERLEIVGTLDYAPSVIGLGNVALARLDTPRAAECFRDALAAPACAAWEKMDAIAGMAEVFASQGESDRAAELFALVTDHPFTAHETRQRAVRRLAEVESGLLAEREHSAPNLDDVVRELIAADRLSQALE